ncbi:acyltransferase [Mucilaginibacter sp. UR6-1]|uniref:acyltransferase family protein n=1 Tax=Mucilaginibacter sp. UR6-1 TaxID=1435643 RepID=UPI001E38C0EE|nr:acyltransferase [Mucilaginibacter sp. UR6-1]MCC8408515.1 acyltransferase [Mucilaginibacter sp. UR6-1]
MQSNQLNSKPHYQILDGLRGVAALIVVIFHICEAHATSKFDMMINHGYLAVDFFFLLSGYVIGYAYDDRWGKLTIGGFFRRRLARLQPMVIVGMVVGAICFYYSDSPMWPEIHNVPVWKLLVVMLVGFTLIPVPASWDIRGWQEMHPLDGPGWSLYFEYIANILYALGLRKLPKWALSILVIASAVALVQYLITGPNGDVIGGWTPNLEHTRIGFTRMMFPFFGGLLLSRITKPTHIKNAFAWCSLLLIIALAIPRIGDQQSLWMNGVYESVIIILLFPLIVYLGASGTVHTETGKRISKFLGDLSYPLYITHYPFIYIYTGWVARDKSMSFGHAIPYALLTFFGSVMLAYAALKWYDEPVRAWLKRRAQKA